MLLRQQLVGSINIGIPTGLSGNIAASEHDVIPLIDQLKIRIAEWLDGFPKEAAP